jgi:hypothetical protein
LELSVTRGDLEEWWWQSAEHANAENSDEGRTLAIAIGDDGWVR